jgi:hypothetical protein
MAGERMTTELFEDCPTCGAAAGTPCITIYRNFRITTAPHLNRLPLRQPTGGAR